MTAREALLRWARRSTARYPGVRVTDFTGSWRDGLAFSALIHRNRPDLVDWKGARTSQPRERLDRVFYVAEREYGVTRLLDPEGKDLPLLCLLLVDQIFSFFSSSFFPLTANSTLENTRAVTEVCHRFRLRSSDRDVLFHPLRFLFAR